MRSIRSALILGSAICMLAIAGGSAWAGGNPPGNNGTVKVDGMPFDQGQSNEPHADCLFRIDFFGFDEGAALTGTAKFELQAPTGEGELLVASTFIGEDPAGGGTDFDGFLEVDLTGPIADSGVSAQPNQGFHVTLTVIADGSIGAMTKHKTYWVDNCEGGEGGGEGGEGGLSG